MTYNCAVNSWLTRDISVSHSTCLLSQSVTVVLCTPSSKCLTFHIYISYIQFLNQYLDIYIYICMIYKQSHISKFGGASVDLHTCFNGAWSAFCQPLPSLFKTTTTTSTSNSGLFTPVSSTFTSAYASYFLFYRRQIGAAVVATTFVPVPLHSSVGVSGILRLSSSLVATVRSNFSTSIFFNFMLPPHPSANTTSKFYVLCSTSFHLSIFPPPPYYFVLPVHLPSSFFLLHISVPFPCMLITITTQRSSTVWIAQ